MIPPDPFPLLLVDFHDSFTWNLAHYLAEAGADVEVVLSDAVEPDTALGAGVRAVVLSPGPGRPEDAVPAIPLILEAVRRRMPLLGVCLGLQAIALAFGGRVGRAPRPVHGKSAWVRHDGRTLFAGLPSPLRVTRYHSLAVSGCDLPEELEVSATGDDGVVMAARHRSFPAEGVQFHPEAVLTEFGREMLRNFLDLAGAPRGCRGSVRRG